MNRFLDRNPEVIVKVFDHTKDVENIQKLTIITNQSKFVGSERRK